MKAENDGMTLPSLNIAGLQERMEVKKFPINIRQLKIKKVRYNFRKKLVITQFLLHNRIH